LESSETPFERAYWTGSSYLSCDIESLKPGKYDLSAYSSTPSLSLKSSTCW